MALTETNQFDAGVRIASLTQREQDFLGHVQAGLTSKQIAQREGMSEHTVNDYIKSAVRKLGANDRREAARLLSEHQQRPREELEASLLAQVSAKELARLLRTGGRRRLIELNGPEMTGVERLAAIAVIVIISLVFVSLVFALVGFSFRELSRVAGNPDQGSSAARSAPPFPAAKPGSTAAPPVPPPLIGRVSASIAGGFSPQSTEYGDPKLPQRLGVSTPIHW